MNENLLTRLLLGITRAESPHDPLLAEVLATAPSAVTGVRADERVRALLVDVAGDEVTDAALLDALGARTDIGGLPTADGGLSYAVVFGPRAGRHVAAYRPMPGTPARTLMVVWPGHGGGPELHPGTGTLRVLGRVIGPGTGRLAADTFRVAGTARWRDRGTTDAELTVDAGPWRVGLAFEGERLRLLTLFHVEPDGVDEAAEQRRRATHDAWLGDGAGEHEWGSGWSGYDDRAGISEIRIRYA